MQRLVQTLSKPGERRTASWLTSKESRASFLIEKEADKADRIQRFAHVIAKYCGHIEDPLSNDSLHKLQAGILGHEVLEMSDQDANRIIRSLKENGWQVSGKLKKAYPQLDNTHRSQRVVEAVRSAFEERAVGVDEE